MMPVRGETASRRARALPNLTRPTAWLVVALLALLGAAPAHAGDARYEGLRELVRGAPSCPTQPSTVSMEIGDDGGVRGEVVTTDGALHFYGTLSAAGRLLANYRMAAGAEYTSVEGVVGDGRIDGFTQSKSCRYSLHLTRR